MCLAVPMRIVAIEGVLARCEAKGVERTVNLILMQHEALSPGDVVMVHVGYAIQTMTEEEARQSWDLIDEMLAEEQRLAQQDLEAHREQEAITGGASGDSGHA